MKYIIIFILSTYSIEIPWTHKSYLPIYKVIQALNDYYKDCKNFPSMEETLYELIASDKDCWDGPYMLKKQLYDRISKKQYKYKLDGNIITIISAGKDGVFGTHDDFKNSDNKATRTQIISLYVSDANFYNFIQKIFMLLGFLVLLFFIKYRKFLLNFFLKNK